MGDCRTGTCPTTRYEIQPQPTYQQPEQTGWQQAACEAYRGKGTTVAVDGQSKADYDKMIKDNFKYTNDDFSAAYKEAARTGKPIVAVFGSWENNNTRGLVQDAIPKSGAKDDAVYLYVDPAKCNNEDLKKFAEAQLAGGHNAAVSIVLGVKPGEDGKPTPTPSTYRWQGDNASMIPSFKEAIAKETEKMKEHEGKYAKDAPAGPTEAELKQAAEMKAQKAAAEKASAEKAAAEKAATEKAAAEKAAAEKAATEKAATEKAAAEKAAAEKAAAEKAAAEKSAAEKAAVQRAAELKAAEEMGRAKAHKEIVDTAVAIAFPGATAGVKVGQEAAKVGSALASENAKDLKVAGAIVTAPLRAADALTKATVDHVKDKPLEAAAATVLAGPPGLVVDVVVNQPAVQKVAGAVADTVKDEAKDTLARMAKYPMLPSLGLVDKAVDVQAKVTAAAITEVATLPGSAKKFENERPTTAAVIDLVPLPLTPPLAKTVIKGGLQKVSDAGQMVYDNLPELPSWLK